MEHQTKYRGRRITVSLVFACILLGLLSGVARAQYTETIQVNPNVPVHARTIWYSLNCTTSLGIGTFAIN
jgi:hypothetical protein